VKRRESDGFVALHLDLDEDAINTTPMIDVAFNLLIFFMLSATFMQEEQEIEMQLPRVAQAAALTEAPEELAVNVLEDGTPMLRGVRMTQAQLVDALRAAVANFPDQAVAVRGHRRCPYEYVLQVHALAKQAGVKKLAARVLEER
jgi:biopolymer transport protein ExbD